MSELNATFNVDEPIFEWPKTTTAKSPRKSQVKASKAVPSAIPTPIRAQPQRVRVSAAPNNSASVALPTPIRAQPQRLPVSVALDKSVPKVPCGPRRVPVTPAHGTPYQNPRHTICATPTNEGEKQAAATPFEGPRRVPVTKDTPVYDPNRLRGTIYATPSIGLENRTGVSVTSTRKIISQVRPVAGLLTKKFGNCVCKLIRSVETKE